MPNLLRAADKITRLAAEPHDLVTLWQETTDVLTHAVPYYWTPCWYTLDPASLLITSHFHYGMAEFPPEWLTAEYYQEDVHKLADVVRSETGISTLHEATNGDPSTSPRWHENIAMGGDQELILGLRTRTGEVWGALGLYREPGNRCSAPTRRSSCARWRPGSPTVPAAPCWSVTPPNRRGRRRPGW